MRVFLNKNVLVGERNESMYEPAFLSAVQL